MILGEDGILAQAKLAAKKTQEAIQKEQEGFEYLLEEITGAVDPFLPNTVKEAIAETKIFTETKQITDEESEKMYVPKGYALVSANKDGTIKYTNPNNPKISEGIVITDKLDANGNSIGNEFVWVPVDDINDMIYCQAHTSANIQYDETKKKLICDNCEREGKVETNFAGKLYASSINTGNNFIETQTQTGYNTSANSYTGIREPDALSRSGYDDTNFDSVKDGEYKDFKEQLQDEFNKMAESVGRYGGFYIGRYETSGLRDNETPKVQKEQNPTVETNWYKMYKNSKNLAKEGSKVTSSMIWGCQWDQVMLWMKEIINPTVEGETKKYIKDSSGMGWLSGVTGSDNDNSEHKTGIDLKKEINGKEEVLNRVKNIYDLAGNMLEWTLEAVDDNHRVSRGSNWRQ